MRHPELQSYCFNQPAHWRAGAFQELMVAQGGLAVPPVQVFAPIPGTDSADATPAMAIDVCDRLHWVRPDEGELFRLYDFGPQRLGRLPFAEGATALVVEATRLWLLKESGILRYALPGLQFLDRIDICSNSEKEEVLAIAGDGRDGIWWLTGEEERKAILRHADRSGSPIGSHIDLPSPISEAALGVSRDGRQAVVLDAAWSGEVGESCKDSSSGWRLIIVDLKNGDLSFINELGTPAQRYRPQLLAVDHNDHIHLVAKDTGEIWTLTFQGELVGRLRRPLPEFWREMDHQDNPRGSSNERVYAISAGIRTALATHRGIGYLEPVEADEVKGRERQSVFVTPTLISPEGAKRGWQRADVEVFLPEGTTLEVSCVATRDRTLARHIDDILHDNTRSSDVKVKLIEDRLQWSKVQMAGATVDRRSSQADRLRHLPAVVYPGSDADGAASRPHYLLHEVEETHLWLRLVLYTPPGRRSPVLESLTVSYPNRSYLRYLPAVYQEDPHSTAQLRRFLALFETLFGELDGVIDRLPQDIDPKTVPNDRLAFLLRWLGLPSVEGLDPDTQRKLLLATPQLLAERGTLGALEQLLTVIVDVPFAVDDLAAGPDPWVLPGPDVHGSPQRLGCDTLIVARQPPAFVLGRTAIPGSAVLGTICTHIEQTYKRRLAEIRIRICATGKERDRIEPIVRRFLPHFVPAHCRTSLVFVHPAHWVAGRRLDDDLVLTDRHSAQIGTAVIGRLRLPETSVDDAVLNRSACIDGSVHLN